MALRKGPFQCDLSELLKRACATAVINGGFMQLLGEQSRIFSLGQPSGEIGFNTPETGPSPTQTRF